MNKWQQELQPLALTDEQKQQMKRNIKKQRITAPKRAIRWPVVITPIVVALSVFFIWLSLNDAPMNVPVQQASQPSSEVLEADYATYFTKHMRLSLAISIGILVNIAFAIAVVMTTTRWQQPRIQKLRDVIYKLRFVLIFVAPFFLYGFASATFELVTTTQGKINTLYVLVVCLIALSFLFAARHRKAYVCCPHCQHEYSTKEKRKFTAYFKMQLHCMHCGEKLFYNKKTRQVSGVTSVICSALILFPNTLFGVPFWLIFIVAFALTLFILFVVLPLFLLLEGEESPLF